MFARVRVWGKVAEAIIENNMEKANKEKFFVEETQRQKRRKEKQDSQSSDLLNSDSVPDNLAADVVHHESETIIRMSSSINVEHAITDLGI